MGHLKDLQTIETNHPKDKMLLKLSENNHRILKLAGFVQLLIVVYLIFWLVTEKNQLPSVKKNKTKNHPIMVWYPREVWWLRSDRNIQCNDEFGKVQCDVIYEEIAPVLYLQSDCDTATDRDDYVKKLMGYINIDSYGKCLNNKDLPLSEENKNLDGTASYLAYLFDYEVLRFISRYKFIIGIENAVCNDYTTEKMWRLLEVGVVPIYYGSPLIRDWLPNNKSAILLEDFPTPELLSRHLHYLLRNDTAYEEYLEHKTFKRITNERLINELKNRPHAVDLTGVVEELECLVCSKLHRNKTGVNIVTRSHFDCALPTSALTFAVNPNNSWVKRFAEGTKEKVDKLYEEILQSDATKRESRTSW